MIGKRRALGMGGASALAIGAVLTFVPGEAAACVATSQSDGGVVSVDIDCTGTPTVLPFTTRYTDGGETPTEIYDGDGNDTLTMTAGAIVATGEFNTPSVDGTFNLDDSAGVVQMLGGIDTVNISGTATIGADGAPINLELGDGDDNFVMSGGTINGTVFGDEGDDDIEVSGNAIITGVPGISAAIETGNGDNDVRILGGTIGTDPTQLAIFLEGGGVNALEMSGGTVNGNIVGQGGGNTYTITGGAINGVLSAGSGNDTVTISGTANITGSDPDSVGLDAGDDTFTMTGGTLAGAVSGGLGVDRITIGNGTIGSFVEGNEGDDTINISGGQIDGAVLGDLGNDNITISGGTIGAFVAGEDGNDTIIIGTAAGGPAIDSSVFGDDGDDEIQILGGTIGTTASPSDVSLGEGADVFQMSGGIVRGSLFAGSGNDIVTISDNAVIEGGEGFSVAVAAPVPSVAVELDDGDDTLTMTGGTIGGSEPDDVDLGAGADTFRMSGGTITGSLYAGSQNDNVTISGTAIIQGNLPSGSMPPFSGAIELNEGDDQFTMTGGTLGGSISGGNGNDDVTISGGTIAGDVEAETIRLTGGTVGGDFFGISSTTLIIDGTVVGDPLNLRNGVVFSGTNAVATVTNEDLAAGGTKTQTFNGFNTVSASNSTLGFGSGTQGIGLLSLGNGSTLFVNGNTNMAGNVVVTGSTINMIDGMADDVFTLGGLTLNGGTIGLDLNQQTGLADQLVAGTFTSSGANTILVNLLGTPEFAQATDIPIIVTTNGPIAGIFAIGVSGTPSALFTYEVIAGPNGGLFIRATPANFGIATAPDSAVNASTVNTAIDALYGINDDAIDSDLGLAHGVQRVQISPTFGVFASGQFAHTQHDGFTISGNNLVGPGPSFDADDFSAAISLDFNAAKHFEFEDRYGLNLGLFAGYASTDVGLGAFQGFDAIGDATNRSGMFGGYALFRQGVNYALVSASAFLGETDVSNGVLNTTGSYDTEGYAVTGSIGHIFALTDRARFDLRGGMLGVSFTGDDYTDSGGNQFGESRISFGAFKFEPGIYADYALDNGMVFSPYARADLQQRFAYKNTATIDGKEIDFDDADFSAALSTGFNLKMSERATLSSEIRGKLSADSSTIGGKLGLKIAF
jgi:hypothetical protein